MFQNGQANMSKPVRTLNMNDPSRQDNNSKNVDNIININRNRINNSTYDKIKNDSDNSWDDF